MLAVGGQLDCLVQVGVPGRGRARGSCWSQPLPPCSQAAWSGSAAGLCPSPALGRGGNPPGEDPLGPVEKTCVRRASSSSSDTKHCSKFSNIISKENSTSVGPHLWYPWSFCSQTIMVPWIDLTETSAFGKVCWNPCR